MFTQYDLFLLNCCQNECHICHHRLDLQGNLHSCLYLKHENNNLQRVCLYRREFKLISIYTLCQYLLFMLLSEDLLQRYIKQRHDLLKQHIQRASYHMNTAYVEAVSFDHKT